ncbi:hypothetical protein DL96DRAFT_1752639 [Flagelloscypha sp. PMI_526]|nr:hypothetical protein DL96DRAFT_1752639 [Flagelloscypha sp. PMI_526]
MALCLHAVSHIVVFFYGSQATLYYSVLLRDENIRTFTHCASHLIHLVRHLCISVCPVNPIGTVSRFAKRREKGNHDQYWLLLISELKKISQLKSLSLTSAEWTIPLVTSTLESAFFQLQTIPSLEKVNTNFVVSSGFPPRIIDWGGRLKAVRVCTDKAVPLTSLEKYNSVAGLGNRPVLQFLVIETLFTPWASFQQHFDVQSVQHLSLSLSEWPHADEYLLENVFSSVASSLKVLTLGWIPVGRLDMQSLPSAIQFEALNSLNIVIFVDPKASILFLLVQPCLQSILSRAPYLYHLRLALRCGVSSAADGYNADTILNWSAFGSFLSAQICWRKLDISFVQKGLEYYLERYDLYHIDENSQLELVLLIEKETFWPFFEWTRSV